MSRPNNSLWCFLGRRGLWKLMMVREKWPPMRRNCIGSSECHGRSPPVDWVQFYFISWRYNGQERPSQEQRYRLAGIYPTKQGCGWSESGTPVFDGMIGLDLSNALPISLLYNSTISYDFVHSISERLSGCYSPQGLCDLEDGSSCGRKAASSSNIARAEESHDHMIVGFVTPCTYLGTLSPSSSVQSSLMLASLGSSPSSSY